MTLYLTGGKLLSFEKGIPTLVLIALKLNTQYVYYMKSMVGCVVIFIDWQRLPCLLYTSDAADE